MVFCQVFLWVWLFLVYNFSYDMGILARPLRITGSVGWLFEHYFMFTVVG
jgi:hypothetical protein